MRKLDELQDLTGRVAIVTGGAGHVGRAAAETLLELGADVAVVDLEEKATKGRASELADHGPGRAFPLQADLSQPAQARGAVRETIDETGRLDVVVHAAAFTGDTDVDGWATEFEDQTIEAWRDAMAVNLEAAFVLAQEAAPALAEDPGGSIVLVSSIYGLTGPDPALYEGLDMQTPAGYSASKGGIEQLVRHLATHLAPETRVNALAPGGIERDQPDTFVDRYEKRAPMDRMAQEEDLKGALALLASDAGAYVTGQTIPVDGGWTSV